MRSSSAALVALGIACLVLPFEAADIKVHVEHDRTADFTTVRSYRWLPTPQYFADVSPAERDGSVKQVLDSAVRRAVERELGSKRLKKAGTTDNTDLFVVYYAAFGLQLDANILGTRYGYLTGWGGNVLGDTTTASPQVLEQGTLVVDILRSDRARAIWRGTASGAVDRAKTDKERRATIDSAVKEMFAQFPPSQ